ncbi:MAG: succinylglutamate desuccinylase/aspartoacylase family protein [Alphaproteobacteria bacterium]|nr:succinylglutamate desuccinylase/aspartoacylase family protein [Alphaproteobacteria bacterium]MBV8547927.1 succinylglutamate desuccinylase/aspartoacylase family protein [Alphaproteobacteria bacterium]
MSQLSETKGKNPWNDEEKRAWLLRQTIQRSYNRDVVKRVRKLSKQKFEISEYGSIKLDANLPVDPDLRKDKGLKPSPKDLPLLRVRSKNWNPDNPTVLITGGVHGYEPSGIVGAMRVLEELSAEFEGKVNFVVYPCVSPIGYEINHRWTQKTDDPNRHFYEGTKVEEAKLLIEDLQKLNLNFDASADLHETNNRDIELREERAARDGTVPHEGEEIIPVGFYLCVTKQEDVDTGRKIVDAVRDGGTQICTDEKILGYPSHGGVIAVDDLKGLCQGFAATMSKFAMTTEIYPEAIGGTVKPWDQWSDAEKKLNTLKAKPEAVKAQVDAVRRMVTMVLEKRTGQSLNL